MSNGPAPCLSCGAAVSGRFCKGCGEKRISPHDYSVTHFAESAFETFTHFDFKSLRALKVLILEPGRLTREYLDGRRKPYVGPIQLFVILNVAFALAGPNSFRTPLQVQEHDQPFPRMKQVMVADTMAERGVGRTEFETSFNDTAGVQGKTWLFAMIPLLAVCLAAIYGFRRYVFEHLIFATHFYAFLLAWMLAAWFGLALSLDVAGTRLSAQEVDNVASLIILAGAAIYLFLALRRSYGDRTVAAAVRSVALTALILPILLAYRFLLFFVTLASMH